MRFRPRFGLALLVTFVFMATTSVLGVGSAGAQVPDHVAPTSADPARVGPYAVGRTSFTLTDPTRTRLDPVLGTVVRDFAVDVWYPSDRASVIGVPKSVMDLKLTQLESPLAYDEPRVSNVPGGFPLVVFSHGTSGIRFQSYFLMEYLASHGYVVVAPDHPGHTLEDMVMGKPVSFDQTFTDRPLDLSMAIDHVLERNATAGDMFEGRIDGSRIAVTGHSIGAMTALMMKSGWVDPVKGIHIAPDPRIDVTIPLAPAMMLAKPLPPGVSLSGPMMLIGGTEDRIAPKDNSDWAFATASTTRKFRVDVDRGGHTSFSNICDFQQAFHGLGSAPPNLLKAIDDLAMSGCGPEFRAAAEVHHCVEYYALVFLNRVLKGDVSYTKYLSHGLSRRLPVQYVRGDDLAVP
jgi:predicted dienelactone hydrolase